MKAAALLALLPAIMGCSPRMEYQPGGSVRVFRAPQTGIYQLCLRGKTPTAVIDTVLLKGDTLGFRRDPQGRLLAVAADQTQSVPERQYRWRFRGDGTPPRSIHISTGRLLSGLMDGAVDAAFDAALDAASDATDRAEDEGLTKYQKDKLEKQRSIYCDPSRDRDDHD